VDLLIHMTSNRGEKLVRGAVAEARRQRRFRWRILTPTVEHELRKAILQSQADGFIVLREGGERVQEVWQRMDVPIVHIGLSRSGPMTSSVGINDDAVGRMAARFFLQRGYRRLAYCGFEHPCSRARATGFVEEASRNAAEAEILTRAPDDDQMPDWVEIYHAEFLHNWLATMQGPVGMLTFNDQIGGRVIEAATEAGIQVPRDLAVMGVDNAETRCEICEPAMSSLDPGQARVGRVAVQLLCRLFDGQPGCSIQLPPVRVVQRESTAAFVSQDPLVASAMLAVEEGLGDGIRVESLGKQLGVSRSTLERSFRAALDCSPAQWIRQSRIAKAKDELIHTDRMVGNIAIECGWKHISDFMRTFKRDTGLTPSQFRKKTQEEFDALADL
jgi:LacI family transcriptional regulator